MKVYICTVKRYQTVYKFRKAHLKPKTKNALSYCAKSQEN